MNPRSLANYFYANIAVRVDDMRYGPFDENKCITARNLRQSGCVVNYGATRIAVWSMARALNASVKETFPARTPSMVYRSSMVLVLPFQRSSVTMMSLILILIFIGVLVMQCSKRSVRDNRNAPKEPTAPVTLVFTDIESSTALWAACPELMPDAVAAHHRLIRSLIVRHRCYEVKTIGDSFMIACRVHSLPCSLSGICSSSSWFLIGIHLRSTSRIANSSSREQMRMRTTCRRLRTWIPRRTGSCGAGCACARRAHRSLRCSIRRGDEGLRLLWQHVQHSCAHGERCEWRAGAADARNVHGDDGE
ncbi:Adenylate and Guanylate cyclase catalytic domain [Trypanosoma vivax]|nr:Adenylate and Guanylate cyclase catalytic domain [Trypanosoma vivax]